MTFAEIKQLLDAGFTHDEIMKFSTESTNNSQDEKPTSVQTSEQPEEQKPDEKPTSEQNSEQSNENKPDSISELRAIFTEMKESNKQLIETIQASNLRNNTVKTVGDDINTTVDDIISSLNPT